MELLKKLFTVGLISVSTTMVFANCSDEERVEMLKAGVSAEHIRSFCQMDVELEPLRDQQVNPVTTEQEKPKTSVKAEEKPKEETASEKGDAERISELEEKLETIENQENPDEIFPQTETLEDGTEVTREVSLSTIKKEKETDDILEKIVSECAR